MCGERGHFSKSVLCRSQADRGSRFQHDRGGAPRSGRSRGRGYHRFQQGVNYTEPIGSHEQQQYEYDQHYQQYDHNTDQSYEQFEDLSGNDIFHVNVNSTNVRESDWLVTFQVNGRDFVTEIDTAAQCNIMSLQTVRGLGLESSISVSKAMISGVHDHAERAYGEVYVPCMYKAVMTRLKFYVMNTGRDLNLLGRSDSTRLGLMLRVHTVVTNDIVSRYNDVLGTSIGCLPGEYSMKIDPSLTPVIHPPRSVPAANREQVKNELDSMERKQIITKVHEPTE